ncbi:MAG: flagellar hook-basal body protein [Pseudomonadota bacterium]
MHEVLAVALQSMQADMARVDQVGMNLANALTPGYKRGVAVQRPIGAAFAAHLAGASAAAGAAQDPLLSGVQNVSLRSDSRTGTLKATGQPLDLALAGKGYFEIATPDGPAYTRQGSFRLDAAGRLVTAQGDPVMGNGGEIRLMVANPVLTASGAVLGPDGNEDAPLAQLRVVDFDAGARLQRLGDGLVSVDADAGMKLLEPREVQLRQGFLENSNVASTQEMTQLVQAVRHFEAMQKAAQGYDDMLGTAIRKLGETS